MGNLPSTVTCDPAKIGAANYGNGFWTVGPVGSSRTFSGSCNYDTTGPVLTVSNLDFFTCITTCSANKQCKAVSWDHGICYEKSSIGQVIPSDRAVHSFTDFNSPSSDYSCPNSNGQVYGRYNTPNYKIECGTDYPGVGDMGSTQTPSFTDCMDTCTSTSGCVAVSYSGNSCYMKNAIGPATPNNGVWGAVLTTIPAYTPPVPAAPAAPTGPSCPASDGQTIDGYLIACDHDYVGGDLYSKQTSAFEDCIAACTSDSACVDVAFASGSCYLKSALTTLSPVAGVWNAKRLNPPSGPAVHELSCPADDGTSYTAGGEAFNVHCYTDYAGGDYKSLATETFAECLAACAAEEECVDVAWNHGSCYLKSSLVVGVGNENVWGAIKVVSSSNAADAVVVSAAANVTLVADRKLRRGMQRGSALIRPDAVL